jgi:hypothetical protein
MIRTFTVCYPGDKYHTLTCSLTGPASEVLEAVFAWFNAGSQVECDYFLGNRMRSLSVNDCVKVDGQWYQCMSVGWKPVTNDYVHDLHREVIQHPHSRLHSAWSALNEIMWQRKLVELGLDMAIHI